MATLPEILNSPIEITIGETKLQAKKATLKDLAAYEARADVLKQANDPQIVYRKIACALAICVGAAYPADKIDEDFMMEKVPLSMLHDESIFKVMETLGFSPPTKKPTEAAQ
jgi:hypothetical protein